jgi:hypothetical protein
MPVTSTFKTVATKLKTIIDTEFAAEGYTAVFDNLHESLGRTRVDIGISLERQRPMAADAHVRETFLTVKFYHLWKQEITPTTVVNPDTIATFAERFERAVQTYNKTAVGNGLVWYFDVTNTEFPNDPTGNKTRFVSSVRAYGNNTSLVETIG